MPPSQVVELPPSPLDHLRVRPRFLQGAFLRFIQFHFSDADRIENEIINDLVWTDDPETTKLLIEPELEWEAAEASRIPAVLVSSGSVTPISQFLNDRLSGGYGQERVMEGGEQTTIFTGAEFMKYLEGSHHVWVKAKTDKEAATVAEEIWFHFLEFQEPIQTESGLNLFNVGKLEEPKQIREEGDHYSSHFVLIWAVYYGWKINREAPILKSFSFSKSTTGPPDTGVHVKC